MLRPRVQESGPSVTLHQKDRRRPGARTPVEPTRLIRSRRTAMLYISTARAARSHATGIPPPRCPSGHGRVLCVGRVASVPGVARTAGRDRRRTPAPADCPRRRFAPVLGAPRLHRARRGHDEHLPGACVRCPLGHGHDEVGPTCAGGDSAARRLRRIPQVLATLQVGGAQHRTLRRGPRHRRDLRRPHRCSRRARRRRPHGGTPVEGGGARGDRTDLFDRCHAEQAPVEDLLRPRQAGRHDVARTRRHPGANLASAGEEGERNRPQGEREARDARHPHDRRCRRACAARARRASRLPSARCR